MPGDGPGVLVPLEPEVRLLRLQDVHLLLQQRQVVRGRRRLQLVLPLRQRAEVVANFIQPLLRERRKKRILKLRLERGARSDGGKQNK